MSAANDIEQKCAELKSRLEAATTKDQLIASCVDALSTAFDINREEVALFQLEADKGILRFLWPAKLVKVGFLPLSSHDSIAARTAREKKVFLDNSFVSKRHASIFEKVRLTEGQTESPQPIQKIISVPIPRGQEIRGVIQVSRKGQESPRLPDFSKDNMAEAIAFARVIGRFL